MGGVDVAQNLCSSKKRNMTINCLRLKKKWKNIFNAILVFTRKLEFCTNIFLLIQRNGKVTWNGDDEKFVTINKRRHLNRRGLLQEKALAMQYATPCLKNLFIAHFKPIMLYKIDLWSGYFQFIHKSAICRENVLSLTHAMLKGVYSAHIKWSA